MIELFLLSNDFLLVDYLEGSSDDVDWLRRLLLNKPLPLRTLSVLRWQITLHFAQVSIILRRLEIIYPCQIVDIVDVVYV